MHKTDIRKAVTEYARQHGNPDVSDVVTAVASELDTDRETVQEELETLEKNGFVYIVNREVKVV